MRRTNSIVAKKNHATILQNIEDEINECFARDLKDDEN